MPLTAVRSTIPKVAVFGVALFAISACGDDESTAGDSSQSLRSCERLAEAACDASCACAELGTMPDRCRIEAPNRAGGTTTMGVAPVACESRLRERLCDVPELDDATLDGCRDGVAQAVCAERENNEDEYELSLPADLCPNFHPD